MKVSKIFAIVMALLCVMSSVDVSAKDQTKAVAVKGDGKVKYVEANGRRLECLVVKTSFFRQQVSCEEMAQTLNPETGNREGNWQERRLGLAETTTTAGDIVPVLVGGVVSPLISANGAIQAARELHCGAECGTTINNTNNATASNHNTNNATNAPVTTIGIENNVDVRLPCDGGCR